MQDLAEEFEEAIALLLKKFGLSEEFVINLGVYYAFKSEIAKQDMFEQWLKDRNGNRYEIPAVPLFLIPDSAKQIIETLNDLNDILDRADEQGYQRDERSELRQASESLSNQETGDSQEFSDDFDFSDLEEGGEDERRQGEDGAVPEDQGVPEERKTPEAPRRSP